LQHGTGVIVVVVVVVGVFVGFFVGVFVGVFVGFSLFTCGDPAGSINEASTVFSYNFDSLLAL
jgi:hypothetical protein